MGCAQILGIEDGVGSSDSSGGSTSEGGASADGSPAGGFGGMGGFGGDVGTAGEGGEGGFGGMGGMGGCGGVVVVSCGTYCAAVTTHNPVAYWRLNAECGTEAVDYMNAHNGTYNGGVEQNHVTGVSQRGTAIDLTDGFVEVASHADLNLEWHVAISIEAWVRIDSLVLTTRTIVNKHTDALQGYGLLLVDNKPTLFRCDVSGCEVATGEPIQDTMWHHIVVGFDGTSMFVVLDGGQRFAFDAEKSVSGTVARRRAGVVSRAGANVVTAAAFSVRTPRGRLGTSPWYGWRRRRAKASPAPR